MVIFFILINSQNDHTSICSRRPYWDCCKNNFKCCYTNVECNFIDGNINYKMLCGAKGVGCYIELKNNTCPMGLESMGTVYVFKTLQACGYKINN